MAAERPLETIDDVFSVIETFMDKTSNEFDPDGFDEDDFHLLKEEAADFQESVWDLLTGINDLIGNIPADGDVEFLTESSLKRMRAQLNEQLEEVPDLIENNGLVSIEVDAGSLLEFLNIFELGRR